jgi:hypothetical protein
MAGRLITRFQCLSCGGVYGYTIASGGVYIHACAPMGPDEKGRTHERRNRRDENLAYSSRGRLLGIQAEGAGVRCLDDVTIEEPQWITKLKARIAKQEDEGNA